MYGAIIGDLAGSIYEYDQTKNLKPIYTNNIIESNSFYSDDTILTIAIKDAIIHNNNYEYYLKKYILKYQDYKPNFKPYFANAFSPNIIKWANSNSNTNSIGNGALMRISPIVDNFYYEKDIIKETKLATIPTHNSEEALYCTKKLSLLLFYLKKGITLSKSLELLDIKPIYKPFTKFNTTCYETLNNCLYILTISTSFEDAIYKTLLMGGDTDTNCCIVGSIAEKIYPIKNELKLQAESKIPKHFIKVLKK